MSINREATIRWKGYDPADLKPKSNKRVWANCNDCEEGRWIYRYGYRDLCHKCAGKGKNKGENNGMYGKKVSSETIAKRVKKLKGHVTSIATRKAIGRAQKGKSLTDTHKAAIKEARNRKKDPLPDGWKSCTITTNKNCADYLGGIAERVLSKIYPNVRVMPYNNIGFDFICGNGYKIDAKSSTMRDGERWSFNINKNKIADYFLLIAFDNRDDLNPIYLWLIPGHVLNHLTGTYISKTTLHKWIEYEQPLNKVVLCCDEMRKLQ